MAKKSAKKEPRTDEHFLSQGIKGNVFLVVRTAFDLASKNDFKGTVREKNENPKSVLYTKGKEDGIYWGLKDDSEQFKNIHSLAKSSMTDLKDLKYSDKVQKLVDAFSQVSIGKGKKLTNIEILGKVKL